MKALVIYESMYGNTREIAEAIAAGIGESADVRLVPTVEALDALTDNPDLVVMGGPTHVHGMSRASTRQAAIADGDKPGTTLRVDPNALGPGVRDVLESIKTLDALAAAFDTRILMSAWVSGRAAKGIARGLRRRGARVITAPESFLVTKETSLVVGETDRARRWGAQLTDTCRGTRSTPSETESAREQSGVAHDAVRGSVPGLAGLHDVDDYPEATTLPGLVVYRNDAPLFFANAENFRDRVLAAVAAEQAPVEWVLLNMEANAEVDLTAIDMLEELRTELASRGIVLALARVKQDALVYLDRAGLVARIGTDHIFPTLPTALEGFGSRTPRQYPEDGPPAA